jgi:hypothetical protein
MGIALVVGRESHKHPSKISSLNDMPLSVSMTFLSLYIFQLCHATALLAARRPLQAVTKLKMKSGYWVLEFWARWALGIGSWGFVTVADPPREGG